MRGGIILLRYLYATLRDTFSAELVMRAMGLVYVTMLSIVPVMALSFLVLKSFNFHRRLEPIINNFLAPLGERGPEITANLMALVDNVQGDVLAGLGVAFLLFTALSMAERVEDSFNYVWRVNQPRSMARRLSNYLSIVIVGPAAMIGAMTLIASIRANSLVAEVAELEPEGVAFLSDQLVPLLLVSGAFFFAYWFLPNTRVRIYAALIGGIVGGTLWAATGSLFANFVVNSTRTLTIYATFAIAVFSMIWLYLCWLIMLIGAQVSFYVQNPEFLRIGYRVPAVGNRSREQAALGAMYFISQSFSSGQRQLSLGEIASELKVPGLLLQESVSRLESAGLLSPTTLDRWLPTRDPADITIGQVLSAIREPMNLDDVPEGSWPDGVTQVMDGVQHAIDAEVAGRSILTLAPQSD